MSNNYRIDLTRTERDIILLIRQLAPFERVEVIKDKMGKPDTYLVHRSQKIVIEPDS